MGIADLIPAVPGENGSRYVIISIAAELEAPERTLDHTEVTRRCCALRPIRATANGPVALPRLMHDPR
jgi:hypothetical protein